MDGRRQKKSRERGYILAMLLAMVTVMGIMLTKAMPSVVTEVQREQEAELIFRGEALRDGIRNYQARTGRYPASLEDLTKVRPRVIRKLYKDPMTEDGAWDLVYAVQPGATGDTSGLPVVGVRSRSTKDSFRTYRDKSLYSDWIFSAADNLYGGPGGQPQPQGQVPQGVIPK